MEQPKQAAKYINFLHHCHELGGWHFSVNIVETMISARPTPSVVKVKFGVQSRITQRVECFMGRVL